MQRGIDHLVLCVRDLEAAAARYSAFGFTTTPRATELGAATALLERNEVRHARHGGMVTIAPEDAFGVTLALVQDEWASG